METLVESALRATVLAVAVAVLLKGLRVASPRVAHQAWAGVAVAMLLLPVVVSWAPDVSIPVLSRRLSAVAVDVDPAPTLEHAGAVPPAPGADRQAMETWHWDTIALLLYGSGVAFLLLRIGLGVRHARALVRSARLVNGRLTHPRCLTPVTIGLYAPVVILPSDWMEWPADELAAVLAHEEAHVRRRDPLIAFATLLNRAVFWFHPLAWWLPRQVSMLSEHACDAVVLSRGHDQHVYAASLLKFAHATARAGRRIAPLGTAMPGSGLPARLRLLATPRSTPASGARLTAIAAAYAVTVALCSAATPTTMPDTSAADRVAPRQTGAPASVVTAWQTRTTEHFDIFYEAAQDDRIDSVIRQAEAAYTQLSSDLEYDLTARVPVILVARDADLADGTQRLDQVLRDARMRLVISEESLDTRAGILVHELTHHFLFEIIPETSRLAPWVAEGLAEHARGLWAPADFRRAREAVERGLIPSLDSVAASDRHWGHALFDFVAAQHGADGVRRYLFALRRAVRPVDAVHLAFEIPLSTFDEMFRAYVTRRFGGG